MNEITFDQLPATVSKLFDKVSNIERLLLEKKSEPQPDPGKPLNIRQAAELLGLAVPTLYSKVSRGEIPCWKSGKRLLFSHTVLMEYLQQDRKKGPSEVTIGSRSYNVSEPTKKH